MRDLIFKIIGIIFLVVAFFFAGLFVGCKSFDPVRIKNELPECNDLFSTMRFYVKSGIKSDALIAIMAKNCVAARKQKQDRDCLKWIFKDAKIDKRKFPEYAYFLECIK